MNLSSDIIEKIIGIIVSSSLLTLVINKYTDYKHKKKILNINFNLLIKDIEDFLSYLQKIILNKKILEEYYLQEINHIEILIEHNRLYKNPKMIENLLDFYYIRTKIMSELIEFYKTSEKLTFEENFYSKNIENKVFFKNFKYINTIEENYKKIEKIFLEKGLEKQIQDWKRKAKINGSFKFISLEDIYLEIKQLKIKKLSKLKKECLEIKSIFNIDFSDEKNLSKKEKQLIEYSSNYYEGLLAEERYLNFLSTKKDITSYDEALYLLKIKIEEIYDIECYLGILEKLQL